MAARPPKETPPPKSDDLAGWRAAIAANRLSGFDNETLVAAIQDLGVDADPLVRNAIAKDLNARFYRILRPRVGYHHPDRGEEIIRRTIYKLFVAIGMPNSKDGQALRERCFARALLRLKDAIIEEGRERRVPEEFFAEKAANKAEKKSSAVDYEALDKLSVLEVEQSERDKDEPSRATSSLMSVNPDDEDDDAAPGKASYDPSFLDETQEMQENIDVERLLESAIPDERMRLAFRLYTNGLPIKSKRNLPRKNPEDYRSIAEAVGVNEKTIRNWIKTCQDILKTKVRKT